MRNLLLLGTTLAILNPLTTFAWGGRGHELVAETGSKITDNKFWTANSGAMKAMSTVPDFRWKSTDHAEEEKPTHWFQVDYYYPKSDDYSAFPLKYSDAISKYSTNTVVKNGTAPWRVMQLYTYAVEALKKGQLEQALQFAGTMTHYVGDLSQPLHVTTNYDGKDTGNPGIHSFFETENLRSLTDKDVQEIETQARALMNDKNFQALFKQGLYRFTFAEIKRSIAEKDKLIEIDKKLDRNSSEGANKLREMAIRRMADGAAVLGLILKQLYIDAGSPTVNTTVRVKDPEWVRLEYNLTQKMCMDVPSFNSDDCQRR